VKGKHNVDIYGLIDFESCWMYSCLVENLWLKR